MISSNILSPGLSSLSFSNSCQIYARCIYSVPCCLTSFSYFHLFVSLCDEFWIISSALFSSSLFYLLSQSYVYVTYLVFNFSDFFFHFCLFLLTVPFLVFYFQFLLYNFNYFKHIYLIDFLLVFEVPGGIVLLCVLYLLILTHNGLIVPYIFILLDCEFIFSRVCWVFFKHLY